MRYSIVFVGALATAASASPAFLKRYYVTEYAYVTDVVTVTAGDSAPTSTSVAEVSVAAVPTSSASPNAWWGKGWGSGGGSWGGNSYTVTTEVPAPAPTTPTSTYVPPPPTSTYVPPPPPTTTSTPPPPPPTTSSTSTTQEATSTTPSSSGGTPAYSDIVVMHHNVHRANHSAPDIAWDQGLADTALLIAKSCSYEHNVDANGGGYGQNIAAGAPSDNISSIITDSFYNNEVTWFAPFFGENTPSDMTTPTFDKFGHFTQIVWKGSTKVGCATYDCTGAGNGPNGLGLVADNVPPFFTVCNYGPPGNYLGEFGENVGDSLNKPTVNWSYGL